MSWRKRVMDLMNEKNINQKELSKLSGITESSVSRYLKSEKKPRVDVLINFSKALEVSVDYLLEDEVNSKKSNFTEIATAIARNGNNLSSEEKNKLIMLILGRDENAK